MQYKKAQIALFTHSNSNSNLGPTLYIGGSLHGIRTSDDWRVRCSMRYLRGVGVPVMIVQPADDPLHMVCLTP